MLALPLVLAVVGVGAPLGASAWRSARWARRAPAGATTPAPAADVEAKPQAGQQGREPAARQPGSASTGELAGMGSLALRAGAQLAQGGTVLGGLAAAELAGRLVEAAGGGKGKADLVRVAGGVALPAVAADLLAQNVLGALGVESAEVKKKGGQAAALAVLAPGALPGLVAVNLLDAGLGLLGGGVQEGVHNVLRQFDVTASGTVGRAVVGAVGSGVSAVVNGLGSIFGGGGPQTTTAVRAVNQILEDRKRATVQDRKRNQVDGV